MGKLDFHGSKITITGDRFQEMKITDGGRHVPIRSNPLMPKQIAGTQQLLKFAREAASVGRIRNRYNCAESTLAVKTGWPLIENQLLTYKVARTWK